MALVLGQVRQFWASYWMTGLFMAESCSYTCQCLKDGLVVLMYYSDGTELLVISPCVQLLRVSDSWSASSLWRPDCSLGVTKLYYSTGKYKQAGQCLSFELAGLGHEGSSYGN